MDFFSIFSPLVTLINYDSTCCYIYDIGIKFESLIALLVPFAMFLIYTLLGFIGRKCGTQVHISILLNKNDF